MGSPEPVAGRCALHTERPAVDECDSCGRAVCLACAIPFRGQVLCEACAARRLGSPPPDPAPVPSSSRPDLLAAGLLAVGLLATFPPWHRSGTLTSPFSAWIPSPDPWPLVACLAMAAAAAVALGNVILGSGPSRAGVTGYAILAAGAAVIVARTLIAAPNYFSPTAAPFFAFAASLGAAAVGVVRLRRLLVA
jgi:hypothetical protein